MFGGRLFLLKMLNNAYLCKKITEKFGKCIKIQYLCIKFKNNEKMEKKKLPELITRKELAEYLGVCLKTLRNYELSGKIHPRRIGGRKYYLSEEITKQLSHE